MAGSHPSPHTKEDTLSIFSRRTQSAPAPLTITHEVLDAIRTSPPIVAAVADAAARKVAARGQLVSALAVLEREAAKNFPGLIAASDNAFAGEKAAAAALHNARRQVDLATGNRINASVALDRSREQIVSELTFSAE